METFVPLRAYMRHGLACPKAFPTQSWMASGQGAGQHHERREALLQVDGMAVGQTVKKTTWFKPRHGNWSSGWMIDGGRFVGVG